MYQLILQASFAHNFNLTDPLDWTVFVASFLVPIAFIFYLAFKGRDKQ